MTSIEKLFGHTMKWVMGEKHETLIDKNLYYCFVNIEKINNIFRFFIVPSKIVSDYVKKQHKFWLNRDKNTNLISGITTMRIFRIGLDNDGYKIETATAKEYENRWDFFE